MMTGNDRIKFGNGGLQEALQGVSRWKIAALNSSC